MSIHRHFFASFSPPGQTCRQAARRSRYCSRWEIGGQPQPGLRPNRTGAIVADGRSGGNRNSRAAISSITMNCSRWEIGGQPQRLVIPIAPEEHCSRWEIGGQPQHTPECDECLGDCSRWEIGGQPQRVNLRGGRLCIVADGRSGGNRNILAPGISSPRIVADGRSGGNRNTRQHQ